MEIKLFSFSGIPVNLHASSILIPVIICAQVGVVLGLTLSLLIYGTLLVHELAHALVAQKLDHHVEEISLMLLGGVTKFKEDPHEVNPSQDSLITVAGPVSNLAIALIGAALLHFIPISVIPMWLFGTIELVVRVNLLLGLFNFIPMLPLDGGRLLKNHFVIKRGPLEGTRKMYHISVMIGLVLFSLAAIKGMVLLSLMILYAVSHARNDFKYVEATQRF